MAKSGPFHDGAAGCAQPAGLGYSLNADTCRCDGAMALNYHCTAATHVGRVRRTNEDGFFASGMTDDLEGESWEGPLGSSGWCLVADGMGGHAAGEVASYLAIECLRAVLRPDMPVAELTVALEETNLALFSAMRSHPDLAGMGTTIAGGLFSGTEATIFNVGDSRIYLFSESRLQQVSQDHVFGGNQLTKCLGGTSEGVLVGPHITTRKLSPGAQLLFCTDGLTNELADHELEKLMLRPVRASDLVSAAVTKAGHDNVTAVLITASSAGARTAARPRTSVAVWGSHHAS